MLLVAFNDVIQPKTIILKFRSLMRTNGLVVRAPGRYPGGGGSGPATYKFLYVF